MSKLIIINKLLGKGTFSEVYEATLMSNNTKVAVKKVFLSNMKDDKSRRDCVNELHLLQNLRHKNIIGYLGSEMSNDNLHIILELGTSGDLCGYIRYHLRNSTLIPEKQILRFASQLINALNYMHSNRIMHRDLKPANIFIMKDNTIKIGDLGLSKYFTIEMISAESVLGSPYYMSPERLLHEKYYFNSDIWSFGCILYELAALKSPFYTNKLDLRLLIKKVISGIYPPIPSNDYSLFLRKLIKMCISVQMDKRPDAKFILHLLHAT